MVTYKCTRCNKIFNHKGVFLRHCNRKNPCNKTSSTNKKKNSKKKLNKNENKKYSKNGMQIPKMEYLCNFCNKTYSTKFNLNKHLKICKKKKEIETELEQKEMMDMFMMMGNKIKELEEKIDNKNVTKIINNELKVENMSMNINLNAYKKTDISHLKDEDFLKVLYRGNYCIPHLIEAIHFNKNKPENHNICIQNIKNKYINVWNGKSWDIRNRKEVLDEIYEDHTELLEDKMEEWVITGKNINDVIQTRFNRFIKKRRDVEDKIKEELELILYNFRDYCSNFKNKF